MSLYKNIRLRREALGMTQDELAKKMGYTSRSTIAKIESGENDIPQSKIEHFAKALQTTPAYLMGWEDNTSDTSKAETRLGKTGRRINEMRQKAGVSMEELAQKSNIPLEILEKIGSGCGVTMDVERLTRIANALNTNVDYLLGFSDDNAPSPRAKSISEILAEAKPESAIYVFGYNGAREKLDDPEEVESVKAFIKYLKENKKNK